MKRNKITNKYVRILYFPLALIQWLVFTLFLSIIGGVFLLTFGVMYLIEGLFLLDKEKVKEAYQIMTTPFIAPFRWWYDYVTKGEIGVYN